MENIFNKFTNHSKQAIKNAFGLALSLGQKSVSPDHLLYGIGNQKGSVGAEILNKSKFDSAKLKEQIKKNKTSDSQINQVELSPTGKRVLEKAFLVASTNKHSYVGTEHLLAAIVQVNDAGVENMLLKNDIDSEILHQQINLILNNSAKFPDLMGALESFQNNQGHDPLSGQTNTGQLAALDFFATNLTDFNIQKNIDPVIGREEEINRLIQILSRRNKNNPILLGDPGVGKTAIVEGLAKKIIEKNVPEVLLGKKIYALDLGAVVAGTSFRGEFENRLRQIMIELKKDPNIILFIDEIHNIAGAGAATGSMDAANLLKPALARGEIRCIGATTTEDYKKYIESDSALERRFQPIMVEQPDIEKTIEILKGIKNNYEIFHQVEITDEAILAAAQLSERYLTDRFLPDKAIDLIDEAASAIKVNNNKDQLLSQIIDLEKKLAEIEAKKQQKVEAGNFNLALDYKKQEKLLLNQINQLREKKIGQKLKSLGTITGSNIAQVVAKITGVPTTQLLATEKNKLIKLEKLLAKKIIAQDEAIKSIAEFIRRSRTGVSTSHRPIGSFMFLGPSGVGKTELAKVLAESVFGSSQALTRIDMSEFAESFNASKLIGSPAGYVGYKEGAKLTDAVKKRPYSVVLFDEIEKAHPQIFNLLLSILEDGHITDAVGKKINFKNTIIIMTSNLGSEAFNQQAALGFDAQTENQLKKAQASFEAAQQKIISKLKSSLRPEFIDRLDKIIIFKPLDLKTITKISQLQIKELQDRMAKNGIKIEVDPRVAKLIAKKSYAPEVGARAVRKTIQEMIENKIAESILNKSKKTIRLKVKNDQIDI